MKLAASLLLVASLGLVSYSASAGKPVRVPETPTPYVFDAAGAAVGPVAGFGTATSTDGAPIILFKTEAYGIYRLQTIFLNSQPPNGPFGIQTGFIVYDDVNCPVNGAYLRVTTAETYPPRESNFMNYWGKPIPTPGSASLQPVEFAVFERGGGGQALARSWYLSDGTCYTEYNAQSMFYFDKTYKLLTTVPLAVTYPLRLGY